MTSMLLSCAVAGLALGVGCGEDGTLEPAAVYESLAVKSRSAIMSAQLSLRIESVYEAAPRPDLRVTKSFMRIWQDASHYRADVKKLNPVGSDHVVCTNCERAGYSFQVTGTGQASVFRPDPSKRLNTGYRKSAFDPRALGYFLSGHQNWVDERDVPLPLDTDLAVGRSPRTASRGKLDGRPAIRLDCKHLKSGIDQTVWLLPESDHAVALIELRGTTSRDGTCHLTQRSWLTRDADSGIWFPTRCVFEEVGDGKTTFREEIVVESTVLNKPIPPEVFTIAGVGLKEGAWVYDRDRGPQPMVISSGKMVPFVEAAKPTTLPRPVSPVAGTRSNWWYAAAAAGFLLAGGTLAVRAVA